MKKFLRPLNVIVRYKYFLLFLFTALLSYAVPFAMNAGKSGRFDFDHFEVFYQILKWWHHIGNYSVTWNPYSCGGATLAGDPQMPLFHPTMLSYLLLPPPDALKVTVIFWVIVGFISMYLLAAELKLSRFYSSLCAFLWVLNGFFSSHTGVMHLPHLSLFVFPALLFLNTRYINTNKKVLLFVIPPVLLLSIISSPHFIWYALPFVCLHFIVEGISKRINSGKYFAYLFSMFIGLGLAGFFLIPAYFWQVDFPKETIFEFVHPWYLPISMVYPGKVTFFDRNGRSPQEFIFFLGPVLIYLFLLSFKLRKFFSSFYSMLIIFIVSYVVGWGSFKVLGSHVWSPLDFVKTYIPGFQAVQVPTRFWVALLPPTIIMSIFALQYKLQDKWSNWKIYNKIIFFIFLLLPPLAFNTYMEFRLFGFTPEEKNPHIYSPVPYVHSNEFYQVTHKGIMMKYMKPNTGIKNCYQGIYIPIAKELKTNHSLLLEAPEGTSFERPTWDRIDLFFTTKQIRSSTIKINQNHHYNWKIAGVSNGVKIISKFHEPLTLKIPPETVSVSLKYFDPSWPFGVKVSVVFFLLYSLLVFIFIIHLKILPVEPPTIKDESRDDAIK